MKVSEFRALIREEVKNVIKENRFHNRRKPIKESYLKDINLWLSEFGRLDSATLARLEELMKTSDAYMESNEKIMDMVDDIMHPDSFNDLPGWIMFYEDLARIMRSKSPKLAKWATEILSILNTLKK